MLTRVWLLSLVLSALAISSLHMWRHRHKVRPVSADDLESAEPVPRSTVSPLALAPPTPRRSVRRAATGMARIHGRVLGPAGPLDDRDGDLTVVAVDGKARVAAKTERDGSFALTLPAGTYRFEAHFEDMRAALDAVPVEPATHQAVLLQLAEGAAIRGTLQPPAGYDGDLEVTIHVRPAGENAWLENPEIDLDGTKFAVLGLTAGKAYDLSFTGDDFRPLTLSGISAPAKGLLVALEKPPVLRGGFGIALGEPCPIRTVIVSDESGPFEQSVFMDRFCRFVLDSLPAVDRVRVEVSEEDWNFDVVVDIPPHGDPPFLCLNSFCREPSSDDSVLGG